MRLFSHPCICWLLFFDVDEDVCNTGFAACGLHATCKNTPGLYKCSCPRGFKGSNPQKEDCQDIDECKRKVCHKDAICRNTPGSFSCSCKKGYKGDGYKKCVDIDECKIVANKVLCTCCILRNHHYIITIPLILIYSVTLKCFWADS